MSTITTIDVTGMTCGHCVSAVTKELEAIDGVGNITVNLQSGGTSRVTFFSTAPVPENAVREAIDEAGYDVAALQTRGAAEEFTRLADVREDVAAAAAAAPVASSGVGPQAVEIVSKVEAESGEAAGGCGCGGCGCGA